jgi:hypothetical protein
MQKPDDIIEIAFLAQTLATFLYRFKPTIDENNHNSGTCCSYYCGSEFTVAIVNSLRSDDCQDIVTVHPTALQQSLSYFNKQALKFANAQGMTIQSSQKVEHQVDAWGPNFTAKRRGYICSYNYGYKCPEHMNNVTSHGELVKAIRKMRETLLQSVKIECSKTFSYLEAEKRIFKNTLEKIPEVQQMQYNLKQKDDMIHSLEQQLRDLQSKMFCGEQASSTRTITISTEQNTTVGASPCTPRTPQAQSRKPFAQLTTLRFRNAIISSVKERMKSHLQQECNMRGYVTTEDINAIGNEVFHQDAIFPSISITTSSATSHRNAVRTSESNLISAAPESPCTEAPEGIRHKKRTLTETGEDFGQEHNHHQDNTRNNKCKKKKYDQKKLTKTQRKQIKIEKMEYSANLTDKVIKEHYMIMEKRGNYLKFNTEEIKFLVDLYLFELDWQQNETVSEQCLFLYCYHYQ